MKNTKERFMCLCGKALNLTLVLFLMIFLTSLINKPPKLSVSPKILRVSKTVEWTSVSFVPNVDLSTQFTYNVKQIFLYLICRVDEKENGMESDSKSVSDGSSNNSNKKENMVWSRIVRKESVEKVFNKVEKNNYVFSLGKGKKVTFELRGNVFPVVGQVKDVLYGEATYEP